MKCPFCSNQESKVIDSRPTEEGEKIRRRRECLECTRRFTTYEIIESTPVIVIKKDKSREVFSREKLLGGLLRACEKRQVPYSAIERAANEIEASLRTSFDREVKSEQIGKLAMEQLMEIDQVAYVRFASVYKEFRDIDSFRSELDKIAERKQPESK